MGAIVSRILVDYAFASKVTVLPPFRSVGMKSMFVAILVLCVAGGSSASLLARDCASGSCRVQREARVERVRSVERDGIAKVRKTVRWVRSR